DPDWVAAMQEEMQQFINQKVWKLVPLPHGKNAIGTKWILKNKRDARGIVVRNKARLVAQGHRQEEGIDYDEPKGFKDPYFPKHVYKVVKALYGLHQAPRAWNEISKKKTKNEAKRTKPDTEWKSVEKIQSSPSPSVKKSTQVNPEAKSQEKQV
ncbi:retrovirus-related pol polyprotein from transposon TNT 1-94, partial [Tanacetum coccineum]